MERHRSSIAVSNGRGKLGSTERCSRGASEDEKPGSKEKLGGMGRHRSPAATSGGRGMLGGTKRHPRDKREDEKLQ